MSALLALLLLGAPAEDASFRELETLFRNPTPEPEPPPGVRAAPGTERHRNAVGEYRRLLADWRAREQARRDKLVALCTAHLERFPKGEHRADVLLVRGSVRLEAGDLAGARDDLEACAPLVPPAAVRPVLIACCRAQGDYRAAVRHAAPDPPADLLEEAGLLDRAIESAKAAGESAKAARWALIGKPFPGGIDIPEGVKVLVLESGKRLPPEVKERLLREFSEKNIEFRFTSRRKPALYVLDEKGTVRAVDPRTDTLTHRFRRILRAD